MDQRDIVLDILMDIETNHTFSNMAISKALKKNQFEDKTMRAFVTRLAEGVVESRITLDHVINQFSKTKVNKCKPMIRCLLRMGAYQILYMDSVPTSAAVNESVRLAKKHNFAGLSGFVNGVLRSLERGKDSITYPDSKKEPTRYLSVKYSMPEWLVDKIMKDYPKQGKQIIEGCFAERKTSIRVNTTKIDKDELVKMLREAEITVDEGDYAKKALLITGYDFIRRVPGYKKGYFTVQDESSMCAVEAAGIKKDDIVLDICAAPGGKTTAAAEYLDGTGHVYSFDISEDKQDLMEENVERLGLSNVTIGVHDATKNFDMSKVDVLIADVPCSGLGIIGRKNDIKYRLDEEQLTSLVSLQREILTNISDMVKPGGTLLYSTCTINPKENEGNVAWFLDNYKDYKVKEERLFLPGVDSCDGFFYTVLERVK